MTERIDFPQLFAAARRGDSAAFDRLFASLGPSLRLYARHKLGSLRTRMESIDVVQDAYVLLLRDLEAFRGGSEGEFRQWVCGIVRNRVRDAYKAAGAERRGGGMTHEAVSEEVHTEAPGPRTIAVLREERSALEEAFEQLPDADKEIIVLRHFEGRDAAATAEELGLTANAVNVRLFRAMEKWRQAVAADGNP